MGTVIKDRAKNTYWLQRTVKSTVESDTPYTGATIVAIGENA